MNNTHMVTQRVKPNSNEYHTDCVCIIHEYRVDFAHHKFALSWMKAREKILKTPKYCKPEGHYQYSRYSMDWEPEGHSIYKIFHWEPEGHHRCTKSMVIAPLRFSMDHLWIVLVPFWLSTYNILSMTVHVCTVWQHKILWLLKTRRALTHTL